MNQAKFIYTMQKMNPLSIIDMGDGNVVVVLRKGVEINHNYKANDRMEIVFKDTNVRYLIKNQYALEDILRIHLEQINFIEPAIEYCSANLEKI